MNCPEHKTEVKEIEYSEYGTWTKKNGNWDKKITTTYLDLPCGCSVSITGEVVDPDFQLK